MNRCLALFVFAVVALAEERSLPNPEILKWQADAQARERAIQRRVDFQLEKARAARTAQPQPHSQNPSQVKR